MKKFLLGGCLIISSLAYTQKTTSLPFTLSGKIKMVDEPAKMILQYRNGSESVKDTFNLTDGSFAFKGVIQKPVKGVLSVLKASNNPRMMMSMGADGQLHVRDGIIVYLDKGNIRINGKTLKTADITGSEAQKDYIALQNKFQPVYNKLQAIKDELDKIKDKKSDEHEELSKKYLEGFKDLDPIEEAFIRGNLNSYVAWNIMADKSMIADPVLYKELYGLFGPGFTNTEDGKQLLERINSSLATQIGQPAPLFKQNDVNGNTVSLASLKGKYVLIDFWASWCGPCRAENPNVVKVYNKYKDKNFEILGVSLDDKKDAWVKAIQADGLPWLQVSDLKGWKNDVAIQYFIHMVPQNLLLDPAGIIIAKNLRGEDLEKKLAEVFE